LDCISKFFEQTNGQYTRTRQGASSEYVTTTNKQKTALSSLTVAKVMLTELPF